MSYEGRIQRICAEGHYDVLGAPYDFGQTLEPCLCGAETVWTNEIDDTNCDAYGKIDMEQFKIACAVKCTCKECGDVHVVQRAKYRVPSKAETDATRTYFDGVVTRYIKSHAIQ